MMKYTILFAALAGLLLGSPLRAEEAPSSKSTEKSEAKPSGQPEKKEKPRRREPNPERPAPRLHPGGEMPAKPERSATRTWLGISTHPVEASLREHLELPEGFGIQVVEVMPDSPAAKAGLRGNDVVVRFDDQRLISPDHLSLLVREKHSGDHATLSLIRKGREESLEVTLGEADEAMFGPWGERPEWSPGRPVPPDFGRDFGQWQEQIRRQQDEILRQQREWMEKWRHHQPGKLPEPEHPEIPPHLKEGKPGAGGPPHVSVSPGFPLHVFGSEGVLNIDNEKGELTLTRKNDDHHLVIKNDDGKVIYEGPFDPEKGVEGLPAPAREQLEIMKIDHLQIRVPEGPVEKPEKTAEPKAGAGPVAPSPGGIL